jgi:predicted small secreted protein
MKNVRLIAVLIILTAVFVSGCQEPEDAGNTI